MSNYLRLQICTSLNLSISIYVYPSIHLSIYLSLYVYIYIYIHMLFLLFSLSLYIYIYIYIAISFQSSWSTTARSASHVFAFLFGTVVCGLFMTTDGQFGNIYSMHSLLRLWRHLAASASARVVRLASVAVAVRPSLLWYYLV